MVVRRVIDTNYGHAREILQSNLDKLHLMAQALIKYETIDEEQLKDIMAGKLPKPPLWTELELLDWPPLLLG